MKGKFSCHHNAECIIPVDSNSKDTEEKNLPKSCLECQHYLMETKEGYLLTYFEWEVKRNN